MYVCIVYVDIGSKFFANVMSFAKYANFTNIPSC